MMKKIKVFVIEPDIKIWQSIRALLDKVEKVEVYPQNESEFHALNSLVFCSMNYSMEKSIVEPAQQIITQIFNEQVSEETAFVISDDILGADKMKGFEFYETFIEGRYNAPIILTFDDEKSREDFKKSKKNVDFPILKEKINEKLFELFIL